MKTKHTLIVLTIGFYIILIGAILKIIHMEFGLVNGNSVLSAGTLLVIIGGFLFLYKLFSNHKFKDFLNS